jgi:hypothetical protein
MRNPSFSSAIETEVRMLRSSSTSAIVGMGIPHHDEAFGPVPGII